MPRTKNVADVEEVQPEVEETPTTEGGEKKTAAKKEPKRGDLPEGYVTPVGLAKVLTEKELHTARDGSHEVKPQMVYSYIKNASKEDPFPIEIIKDSINADRQAVKLDAGLEWWERKNKRTAEKKANAAEKAKKAEENKAKKAAAAEAESSETTEVTEAE